MQRGFTLLEVLLVTAIFLVLLVAGVASYTALQKTQIMEVTRSEIVQNMRVAQTRARAGENDLAQGVYFNGNAYTIFQVHHMLHEHNSMIML